MAQDKPGLAIDPALKGCFIMQRQFAYIAHFVAQHLKENYGLANFCGYVYRRQGYDFLRAQNDLNYSTLLLDEDIHNRYRDEKLDPEYLDYLEKEFGLPSLWPYLTVDRVIMSSQLIREYPYDQTPYTHEEILRLLQVRARAILEMLDRERPDYLFCSALGGIGSLLIYHIAKKRGLKVFNIQLTSVRNHYILSDAYDSFTTVVEKLRSRPEALLNSEARPRALEFLEKFRTQPFPYYDKSTPTAQPVARARQLKFLNPVNAVRSLKVFLKYAREHFTGNERYDYSHVSPWNYLRDLAKRKIRNAIGLDDLYDEFNPDENFVLFPLHYEPEVAILLQAQHIPSQLTLIRQIARSLPVRYKLCVKEHPEMVQYRPRAFFKELKKIPNVKLIRPTTSNFSILPHAKLITTITGSTGWEALLLKKPVISFGHHFYNSISMVKRCTDIETLPALIKQQIENPVHDEAELQNFLTAIFEDSIEMNLHQLWQDEDDLQKKKAGLQPLADKLASELARLKSRSIG